ncbi:MULTISPECIES: Holliday junction branch migration protein RuvA [unclassified Methylobacterium]|uniref:Holliday junction branch migration protein RuvA n=1 Tax=unclassified Methylobacterium TaxID=2615210 RepID=UPI0011C1DFDC|nr:MULTISPECIES: Holliday junction branch migration protein RuvA [unclassified Methylobacterium]QEE37705.1 Holliday junction branch migration protein RuvA [Methylobacterium sp. WL1]TXN02941.1 Holliday junction branch migration protein RuvA [Methylobacterium sp. WL64]TXN56674.1 Holliday junction branch migration protein RuvA [Methylobacterium sp. WL2]
MIGKLRGVVDSFGEDFVILDVSGVGYIAHCSARTLQRMPKVGEPADLSIETYVREDMIRLYGFRSDAEREWFRLLQTVQGVGSRVALAILSVLEPDALANAIATGDKGTISRAPGVGPRLAARLTAELKDKAPTFAPIDPALVALTGAVEDGAAPRPVADAISALVNLGYPQVQAASAIASVLKGAGEGAEAKVLIRLGLRELAR